MKKRITSIVLCIAVMFMTIAPIAKAAPKPKYETKYNNTVSASSSAVISSTGKLTIYTHYTGIPNRTIRGDIKTYIDKKTLFFFWTRVNINHPGNEWNISCYNYYYDGHRTFQLTSGGTYRVTVIYTIRGNGGSPDVITHTITKNY